MANPIIIDKDIIDKTAFDIVRKQGIEVLSARNIAKQIGCSTKPIYRVYENMDELKVVVVSATIEFMQSYIFGYHKMGKPLLDSGLGYINFVKTEKELFRFISTIGNQKISSDINSNKELYRLLAVEFESKHFSQEKLNEIAEQIITYVYGLAMMFYLGTGQWSEDEVADKLRKFVENITNCVRGEL